MTISKTLFGIMVALSGFGAITLGRLMLALAQIILDQIHNLWFGWRVRCEGCSGTGFVRFRIQNARTLVTVHAIIFGCPHLGFRKGSMAVEAMSVCTMAKHTC